MKLSELKEKETRLKLVQWGESKAGKSYRAASAAAFGPVYIFDFDGNIQRTIADYEGHPLFDKIEADVYNNPKDPESVKVAVEKKLEEIEASIKAGKPKYATIVFDSWTAWQQIVLEAIMGPRRQGGKPESVDWQRNASYQRYVINKIFNGFRPLNIIVNCHVKWIKDEQLGMISPELNAYGQVALNLHRFSNELHWLDYKNGKHLVKVVPDNRIKAYTDLKPLPNKGLMEDTSLAPFKELAFTLSEE